MLVEGNPAQVAALIVSASNGAASQEAHAEIKKAFKLLYESAIIPSSRERDQERLRLSRG